MTHLLPRSAPERQSVPSAAISRLIGALDGISHIHTLTVVRHGHVIAEATWAPYERELPTAMYSVSKSFTSIAVGLAVAEGRLAIDDRVIDLLPALAPGQPSAHLAALRVRHLLTMTTGHAAEPSLEDDDWARAALEADLPHEPGTHWLYNTPATHLLSQILQTLTGERLLEYLRPRLFDPLGFRAPEWEQSPTGVDAGGSAYPSAPRSSPPSASCSCSAACGRGSSSSRQSGSITRRAARWPTTAASATGTRVTDSSSGAAATTRTAATVRSDSTSS